MYEKIHLLHGYIKIARNEQHSFFFHCMYSGVRMYLAKYVFRLFIQLAVSIYIENNVGSAYGLNLALQIYSIMLLYYNMLSCSNL